MANIRSLRETDAKDAASRPKTTGVTNASIAIRRVRAPIAVMSRPDPLSPRRTRLFRVLNPVGRSGTSSVAFGISEAANSESTGVDTVGSAGSMATQLRPRQMRAT